MQDPDLYASDEEETLYDDNPADIPDPQALNPEAAVWSPGRSRRSPYTPPGCSPLSNYELARPARIKHDHLSDRTRITDPDEDEPLRVFDPRHKWTQRLPNQIMPSTNIFSGPSSALSEDVENLFAPPVAIPSWQVFDNLDENDEDDEELFPSSREVRSNDGPHAGVVQAQEIGESSRAAGKRPMVHNAAAHAHCDQPLQEVNENIPPVADDPPQIGPWDETIPTKTGGNLHDPALDERLRRLFQEFDKHRLAHADDIAFRALWDGSQTIGEHWTFNRLDNYLRDLAERAQLVRESSVERSLAQMWHDNRVDPDAIVQVGHWTSERIHEYMQGMSAFEQLTRAQQMALAGTGPSGFQQCPMYIDPPNSGSIPTTGHDVGHVEPSSSVSRVAAGHGARYGEPSSSQSLSATALAARLRQLQRSQPAKAPAPAAYRPRIGGARYPKDRLFTQSIAQQMPWRNVPVNLGPNWRPPGIQRHPKPSGHGRTLAQERLQQAYAHHQSSNAPTWHRIEDLPFEELISGRYVTSYDMPKAFGRGSDTISVPGKVFGPLRQDHEKSSPRKKSWMSPNSTRLDAPVASSSQQGLAQQVESSSSPETTPNRLKSAAVVGLAIGSKASVKAKDFILQPWRR